MAKSLKADALAKSAADTLDPVFQDELTFTEQAGLAIASFVSRIPAFLGQARRMELQAKATLERARTLKPITESTSHEAVQVFVKRANADKKAIVEHWGITSLVSQMHKRLVAHRERGVKYLEEAATIGNRLANAYVEAEQKRARDEQDRLRREAEAKAQRERDAELAGLELKALEAERESRDLSRREQTFVREYVMRGEHFAPLAAKSAGYKDPAKAAERLLDTSKIIQAIEAAQTAARLREQATAVADTPLDVVVETVEADLGAAAGSRTTYSADLFDEAALIEALLDGKLPRDVARELLTIRQPRLNQYARDLREVINRWAGVRLVKTTKVS